MIFIYFFYGLAFLATGLILGLQMRGPFAVLPPTALPLLAAFALLHGSAEWMTSSKTAACSRAASCSTRGWLRS